MTILRPETLVHYFSFAAESLKHGDYDCVCILRMPAATWKTKTQQTPQPSLGPNNAQSFFARETFTNPSLFGGEGKSFVRPALSSYRRTDRRRHVLPAFQSMKGSSAAAYATESRIQLFEPPRPSPTKVPLVESGTNG